MSALELVAELTNDGDTCDMANGYTLRLVVEPDPDASVRDYDADGMFSEYSFDYDDRRGRRRPAGMDGNAEKIQVDRGSFVWWQPPADVPRTDPHFTALRSYVRDRLELGYVVVTLELLDSETDGYGRRIVRSVASVGGVDDLYPELLDDLAAEVLS